MEEITNIFFEELEFSGVEPNNGNDPLMELVKKFGMEAVMPYLKDADITYGTLQYIKSEDLKDVIPSVGLRIEFREKLFAWRKKEFGIDDETLSVPSKVQNWLECSPESSTSNSCLSFNKNLKELLMETSKGKAILESYKNENGVTDDRRNDLINIIAEDALFSENQLSAKHFIAIVDEICKIFPSEKDMKEYYYIPRRGGKNPSGKLYSKYFNLRFRKKKGNKNQSEYTSSSPSEVEFDEVAAEAYKSFLKTERVNWVEIVNKWEKSFNIRQKDLRTFPIYDFLDAWPLYKDLRFVNLIKIDFGLKHPNKNDLLTCNLDNFKEKIKSYYEIHIHNDYCKQLFKILKSSKDKNTQDYITFMLLNSVLPATARFKNSLGKKHKKFTICDANESFITRVTSIDDFQPKLEELVNKYFFDSCKIRPFLFVEGNSDEELNAFYIYFAENLYQFDTFISCLETCFKMFHVLSISYPKPCNQLWIFIQIFFFNITKNSDLKSTNLTSLLSYMKN